MQWIDRVLDYYVRNESLTYVAAIGNYRHGNHTASPAKAYNTISVGGITDQNNANWSDDSMWGDGAADLTSPWQDPQLDNGSYGDREKPEVVATAKGLDLISLGGIVNEDNNGTSFAAPQVAGLAALILQRDNALRKWSEGIRAIIMASAIHNVEGESRLSEKDGVGAIDADASDKIMQQHTYAFRGFIYNNTDYDSFRPDNYLSQEWNFWVKQGDRMRAVIVWDSDPASSYADGTDKLNTDLDLVAVDPDNDTAAYSASSNNNYEIVDFVANATGTYKILVYRARASSSESSNWLGVAWTKVARYDANILNHTISGVVLPNRDYAFSITLRNDGNVDTFADDDYDDWTWPNGGSNPVDFACRWYDSGNNFVPVAVDWRNSLPANLPPGDMITIEAKIHTPTGLGKYTLKCDMVHEGISWFEDAGDQPLSLSVAVTDVIYDTYLPLVLRDFQ